MQECTKVILFMRKLGSVIMKYYTKDWYLKGCNEVEICDNTFVDCDACLHDAQIVSVLVRKKKLILEIDNSGSLCEYRYIVFDNFKVIEDVNLTDLLESYIIAEEIYMKENKKIELHLLLQSFDKGRSFENYFTLQCTKIVFTETLKENTASFGSLIMENKK